MFFDALRRAPKGAFCAKVGKHTLQGPGITPVMHLRLITKRSQLWPAPAQAQELFTDLYGAKGGEPLYFFLTWRMAEGFCFWLCSTLRWA